VCVCGTETFGTDTGGTVTDGVLTVPTGVGTVTEGTVLPWGSVMAPLNPTSAARLEVNSPTTSATTTAIFRGMTG
jgi:hypothetical protein